MGGVTSRLFGLSKSVLVGAGQEAETPVGLATIALRLHNPSYWTDWYVENQLLALGGAGEVGAQFFIVRVFLFTTSR